jgi:hypothetical protein
MKTIFQVKVDEEESRGRIVTRMTKKKTMMMKMMMKTLMKKILKKWEKLGRAVHPIIAVKVERAT